MISRLLLAAIVIPLCWQTSAGADSLPIDRTLRREPAYRTKPEYCLLVFGPEAKRRVWLVTAGEAFYADTNGDGDLAERGKRLYAVGNYRSLVFLDPDTTTMWFPVPENERIYEVGDIFDAATRTWYNVTVRRSGRLKTAVFDVLVDVKGKFRQLGKLPRFGDSPQNAPVLHFDGPLTVGLFTSQLIRGQTGNELAAWVGTNAPAGTKGQATYVVLDDGVPGDNFPIARIEFPNRVPVGKAIEKVVWLDQRDRPARFVGWIRVPEEAGLGNPKVTLTVPRWKWHRVQPATVEIAVVDSKQK